MKVTRWGTEDTDGKKIHLVKITGILTRSPVGMKKAIGI